MQKPKQNRDSQSPLLLQGGTYCIQRIAIGLYRMALGPTMSSCANWLLNRFEMSASSLPARPATWAAAGERHGRADDFSSSMVCADTSSPGGRCPEGPPTAPPLPPATMPAPTRPMEERGFRFPSRRPSARLFVFNDVGFLNSDLMYPYPSSPPGPTAAAAVALTIRAAPPRAPWRRRGAEVTARRQGLGGAWEWQGGEVSVYIA